MFRVLASHLSTMNQTRDEEDILTVEIKNNEEQTTQSNHYPHIPGYMKQYFLLYPAINTSSFTSSGLQHFTEY